MFARLVEARIKPEKQQEFRSNVLPEIENTIRRQPGFIELVGLTATNDNTQVLSVTFWRNQNDVDNLERNVSPTLVEKVRPYLQGQPTIRTFNVETNTGKKIATAA